MDLRILEIASNTENNKIINNFTHKSKNKNPICGDIMEISLVVKNDTIIEIIFSPKIENLSEVILKANRIKAFQLKRLEDSKGTSIYAGKKMR